MALDRKGESVKQGDVVMVPAVVVAVDEHEAFANVTLETMEPMFPGDHKTPVFLNSRQVEVVHPSLGVLVVKEETAQEAKA